MSRAQLFESMKGESTCESTEATYDVKYTLTDKSEPSVPLATTTRTQMLNAQLFKSMGNPGNPSTCNPATPYVPKFHYLSSEPSPVSARFGKPRGSDQNDLPVWKKIAQKKEQDTVRRGLLAHADMNRAKRYKEENTIQRSVISASASTPAFSTSEPENQIAIAAWQTPVLESTQHTYPYNDNTAGSLDAFLLPKLTAKKTSPKSQRYGEKPTPQRWVKDWNKRHAKTILIVKKKPQPEELADRACKSHLATIERCQPTQWLSPFGGNDGEKHLHATAGTADKDWMGEEWLDEDEFGNIDEEKLLQFGDAGAAEETTLQNSEPIHIEKSDDVNNNLEDELKDLLPTNFPINYIARKSEFFGKCRVSNKLAKSGIRATKTKPGRFGLAHAINKNSSPKKQQTQQHNAHPGLLASASVRIINGTFDMSHHIVHSNFLSHYLREKKTPEVQELLLNDCRLEDAQAIDVIRVLQLKQRITCLDLSNNKLNTKTANVLAELVQQCKCLCDLRLSGTFPNSLASTSLITRGGVHLSNLTRLDLSHNRISSISTIEKIAVLLRSTKTLELGDFSWNNFGPKGSMIIAQAFACNQSLKHLSLAFTGMGERATILLAKGLSKHRMLGILNVDGNVFGDGAALLLRDNMLKASVLRGQCGELYLRHNKLTNIVVNNLMRTEKRRLMLHVFPLIVGDGEGSTDPTVSVVYQVPK